MAAVAARKGPTSAWAVSPGTAGRVLRGGASPTAVRLMVRGL
jgi:hypothetical protein